MIDLLRVDNLSKQFIIKPSLLTSKSIIHAVRQVSFVIGQNESLGLIGDSGCGKSTVALMILRLLAPSAGEISFAGQQITRYTESQMHPLRKDLQIIFQHTKAVLDPKMTVDELLREPLKIHRIVPDAHLDHEVNRLLDMVGLVKDEGWKYPDQLSGGQYQRVIIARAIATRPRLIVCDEPVSALDVSVQGQILNLLTDLKQELQLSYLFISHDMKVIRHMCNRVAVMKRGEIKQMGNTGDILGTLL